MLIVIYYNIILKEYYLIIIKKKKSTNEFDFVGVSTLIKPVLELIVVVVEVNLVEVTDSVFASIIIDSNGSTDFNLNKT